MLRDHNKLGPEGFELEASRALESRAQTVRMHVEEAVLLLLRRACTELNPAELTMRTPLLALGLDSLKVMEIIFDLEEHCQVQVDEALLIDLDSVTDLVSMLCQAITGAGSELPKGMPQPWVNEES